jgi:hypothetical protein
MKNTDMTERHLLLDKVDVNLGMLRAAELDWIKSHVDCTDIVTINNGCSSKRMTKLLN